MKLKRSARILVGFIVCYVVFVVIHSIYRTIHRPIFFDRFGQNDRMLFPDWVRTSPAYDESDNCMTIDRILDLAVLIPSCNGRYTLNGLGSSYDQATPLIYDSETQKHIQLQVDRSENILFVFDGSSTLRKIEVPPDFFATFDELLAFEQGIVETLIQSGIESEKLNSLCQQ